MNFSKVKVKVHAEEGRCLVHLCYGNSADPAMEEKLIASLKKAKIHTDYVAPLNVVQDPEAIQSYLDLNNSLCYRLESNQYTGSDHNEHHDGHTLSFYTATKDLARGALTQLSADHIHMNKSTRDLKAEIDRHYTTHQARA